MKSTFDFEEQNQLEIKWEETALAYWESWFGKKVTNVRRQHLPYDFSTEDVTFDLKVDTPMHKTGNFFLETESVKGRKKGWIYNRETDFVFYIDDIDSIGYVIPLSILRLHENEIRQYKHHEILNDGWLTCGHTVPIRKIRDWIAWFLHPQQLSRWEGQFLLAAWGTITRKGDTLIFVTQLRHERHVRVKIKKRRQKK